MAAVTALVVASECRETGLSGEALARTTALAVCGRTPRHLTAPHRLLVTSPVSFVWSSRARCIESLDPRQEPHQGPGGCVSRASHRKADEFVVGQEHLS